MIADKLPQLPLLPLLPALRLRVKEDGLSILIAVAYSEYITHHAGKSTTRAPIAASPMGIAMRTVRMLPQRDMQFSTLSFLVSPTKSRQKQQRIEDTIERAREGAVRKMSCETKGHFGLVILTPLYNNNSIY